MNTNDVNALDRRSNGKIGRTEFLIESNSPKVIEIRTSGEGSLGCHEVLVVCLKSH